MVNDNKTTTTTSSCLVKFCFNQWYTFILGDFQPSTLVFLPLCARYRRPHAIFDLGERETNQRAQSTVSSTIRKHLVIGTWPPGASLSGVIGTSSGSLSGFSLWPPGMVSKREVRSARWSNFSCNHFPR